MNSERYCWCAVSNCGNTILKTPNKLFIRVPDDRNTRNIWLQLGGRDPNLLSAKSRLFFCEDHFSLENDMENFMQYKLMGSVKRIRMKQNCLPSRFDCLKNISSFQTQGSTQSPQTASMVSESCTYVMRCDLIQDTQVLDDCSVNRKRCHEGEIKSSKDNKGTQTYSINLDKSVQTCIPAHHRTKQTQTVIKTRHSVVSPIKLKTDSKATSPIVKVLPSSSGTSRIGKRKLQFQDNEDKSESDSSSVHSMAPSKTGSSSITSSPQKMSNQPQDSTSESTTSRDLEQLKEHQKQCLQNTMTKIIKKPRLYLGISKENYFLIDILSKHTQIPQKHILMCLNKIRLNSTYSHLADDFGLSISQVSKVFVQKIPLISKVLGPFIKQLTSSSIKRNLPIAFRHKYHKVTCIIDCLEIEIQKPTKAINQALTWSEYKKGNTIKYLIACSPDGLVTYISPGFGGRASDMNIIMNCKFLETLAPSAVILADRGFKNIESLLQQRGFTLVRPPSVTSGSKLTKIEARKTKQIASLRIHVERVIRRVREFSLLQPHSVVNTNLIKVLDECLIIACALVNLQDSIIK